MNDMKRLKDLQKGDMVYLYDETKMIVKLYEVESTHELSSGSSSTYNDLRHILIRVRNSDEVIKVKFFYYIDTDECEYSILDEVIDENDRELERIAYINKDEILDKLQSKLSFIKEQMEKVMQVPHNLC